MSAKTINRILCVDDDEVFRKAIVLALQTTYPNVLGCNDGKAIEIAERYDPDLIILDVFKPQTEWEDGIALFRVFKLHKDLKHVPVVFISSVGDDKTMDKYIRLGAIGVIPKPLNVEKLPCAIGLIWSYHQSTVKQFLYNLLRV
jgi:PleD family two-component response regulator